MFPQGGCPCGRDLAAARDLGVAASHQVIDTPLVTAAVFLLVAHHVPVERCAGIVESLTEARPSDGFVHAMLARAAQRIIAARRRYARGSARSRPAGAP